jgi:hypothetical protein
MLTFLLVLILVFIGVELLVRFVIDPLASGSYKKSKDSKSYAPRFDPTIRLVSETMYDGGKLHDENESSDANKNGDISKETNSSLKQ